MGVELIIIGIIAGAAVLISGISAGVSIGTIFHFKRKFKAVEKVETKDTTDITIKNKATTEDHGDGSTTTIREQDIHIKDIDMEMGSRFISGSTSVTRTGLPNKTAETLASGATGALNKLTAGVVPQLGGVLSEDTGEGVGSSLLRGGMKLIEVEDESEASDTKEPISRSSKHARRKIELDELSVDSEESSEGHIERGNSGKQEAVIVSSSEESAETTQEGHITGLVTSVIEDALGHDMVEMLSIPMNESGVMGEATVETIEV